MQIGPVEHFPSCPLGDEECCPSGRRNIQPVFRLWTGTMSRQANVSIYTADIPFGLFGTQLQISTQDHTDGNNPAGVKNKQAGNKRRRKKMNKQTTEPTVSRRGAIKIGGWFEIFPFSAEQKKICRIEREYDIFLLNK